MIKSFETHFPAGMTVQALAKGYLAKRRKKCPDISEREGIIQAEVNWGRWIVECPHCHNAEFASFTEPYFMCSWCANQGGKWVNVDFPKNREQIEHLLMKRPEQNQNWKPGETVKQLAADNKRRGI